MLIGYARPTSDDSSCQEQCALFVKMDCERVIKEEHFSTQGRLRLEELMATVQQGDMIVVSKLAVFADSPSHLYDLLNELEYKGGFLKSLDEGIDTSEKSKSSFKDIIKIIVDFQSDLISEKTKVGLLEAKQNGVVAGRPRIPDENLKNAIKMYESKQYSLAQIKSETNISKSTLYRYLGK